jgi:hypothetical protein
MTTPATVTPEALEAFRNVARLVIACVSRQGEIGFIVDAAHAAFELSGETNKIHGPSKNVTEGNKE